MSIQYMSEDIQSITDREDSSDVADGLKAVATPAPIKPSSSSDQSSSSYVRHHRHRGRGYKTRKARETFAGRWPFGIGLTEVITGFIITILGIVEFFVIPVLEDEDKYLMLGFSKQNCYGTGLWTGPLLIITGCMAIRASISRRASTIYNWFWLSSITVFLFSGAMLILIIGYVNNWLTLPMSRSMYTVHTLLSVIIFIGLLLAVVCFFRYYEDVFFGELNLFRKLVMCCCPRYCPWVEHKSTVVINPAYIENVVTDVGNISYQVQQTGSAESVTFHSVDRSQITRAESFSTNEASSHPY